jgi:4'-phosphopantetheinyl transferase EntD
MDALGGPVSPVGRDRFGAPIWPAEFVGSISHGVDASTVLVARRSEFSAVGLDRELVGRFDASLWHSVFTPREMETLRRLPRCSWAELATVLFAAKEAIQKARYAATHAWAELSALDVALDVPRNAFSVRGDETLAGHFLVDGHAAVAACWLRPLASSRPAW